MSALGINLGCGRSWRFETENEIVRVARHFSVGRHGLADKLPSLAVSTKSQKFIVEQVYEEVSRPLTLRWDTPSEISP